MRSIRKTDMIVRDVHGPILMATVQELPSIARMEPRLLPKKQRQKFLMKIFSQRTASLILLNYPIMKSERKAGWPCRYIFQKVHPITDQLHGMMLFNSLQKNFMNYIHPTKPYSILPG